MNAQERAWPRRKTPTKRRNAQLRQMLEERRNELRMRVFGKMRDVRSQNRHESDVPGHEEMLETDVREDIDLALIQMTAETLGKIDAGLDRLAQGAYGNCSECGGEIAEARLRALPFAIRCRQCEEAHERAPRAPMRVTSGNFDLLV